MAKMPINELLNLIQKRFLSTSTTISSSPLQQSSSFAVQYLINSCGLSLESALSTSQKLKIDENNLQRPQSVLNFLKSHGFDDTHIGKLVQKHPCILHCGVESNLKPKWEYLSRNGFTGTLLAKIIVSNPEIFRRSLEGRIKPSIEFLKKFLGSDDNVIAAIKNCSFSLTSDLENTMKPNIDFLINEGVPLSRVSKLIMLKPRAMMQKLDTMVCDFNAVKQLGVEPTSPMFIHSLRVMIQLSESTLKKKMEVFKSLGWTEENILSMFKQNPTCFACSEERIRSTVDFLVNTVKVEPEFVIAHPVLLKYAISRMHMRFKILKALESKKLLEWDNGVAWLLTLSENKFINYVEKYKKNVPGLLEMFKAEKLDI